MEATVSDLGEDLAQFSEVTADSVAAKQDKPTAVSCTIPTTGWGKDSTAGYPNYYDIAASGVMDKDRAEISLNSAGVAAAVNCGLCPTCETLANKIRVRSMTIPSAAIAAEYWIEQGKE